MACRIGITTAPDRRKQEWQKQYPHMSDWKILTTCSSKSEAQAEEERLSKEHGCEAHPGGDGNEDATWYVYMFNH